MLAEMEDAGLVKPMILPFLKPRDVLALACVSRELFSMCTHNSLGIRGRRRVLSVDNCVLSTATCPAASELGIFQEVSSASVVVGAGLMLSLTQSVADLFDSRRLRCVSIRLDQNDYFFWLLNLTLIAADFRNSSAKTCFDEISIDFGADGFPHGTPPAPVLSDIFGSLALCKKLRRMELRSVPLSSGLVLQLPARLERLVLDRWLSIAVEDLSRLSRLTISSCCLGDSQAEAVFAYRAFPFLEVLELPDNLLTSVRKSLFLAVFSPRLRKLDFGNNRLAEDFDSVVLLLKNLPGLTQVGLDSNMLGDEGLAKLAEFGEALRDGELTITARHNGIRIASQISIGGRNLVHCKILFE